MSTSQVTAVSIFHAGEGSFTEWAGWLTASAAGTPGCLSTRISDASPDLQPAVAVTFADEDALDRWLDGPARAEVLSSGRSAGWWPAAPVLVLTDGATPPGVAAFRHRVTGDRIDEFRTAQRELTAAAAAFAGYEGTSLFVDDDALSVLRFRSDRHLAAWLSSAERDASLPELRSSLDRDFAAVSGTTGFGTTVRADQGRILMTPNWKSAMMVLLVLYPTVMLLSRFVGPVLNGAGAPPWLALWLSQVASVVLMQWWLVPWASRPFRRWLDPVDGSGRRSSLAGAVVVLVLYAGTLLLFESVTWLQFWDYNTP